MIAWASVSNSALWNARTSSGSSRSASAVKPERSAKSTVTWRRSASRLGPVRASRRAAILFDLDRGRRRPADVRCRSGVRAAPQRGQNAKSGSHVKPHAGQGLGSRRPHRGQKAKPGDAWEPQPAQVDICQWFYR